MLASFWCDIVEAYSVKGAMKFSINNSFICEKKTVMGNSLASWLEFENQQAKTTWPSLIHECLSLLCHASWFNVLIFNAWSLSRENKCVNGYNIWSPMQSLYSRIVHVMALSRLCSRIHLGFVKYEFRTLVLLKLSICWNTILCSAVVMQILLNYFANLLPVADHRMERMVWLIDP